MKVLFNLPSIPRYVAIFEMCKSLASKLDGITVVTNDAGRGHEMGRPANLRLLQLPSSKPRFFEGLLSKSDFRNMDIIHDTFGYFSPLGALAKFSKDKKYVTSVWGSSAGWYYKAKEVGFGDESELKLHRNLMRREYLNSLLCDAILVNSQAFSADYINYFGFPERKIYNVPESVIQDSNFRYSERKDGPFRILYVGHVSKMKGIYILLEAFQRLLSEGNDAQLTIVGGFIPHDREVISGMRNPNVKFVGPVPHGQLESYYRDADLYVHPSYQEGMPRVVMEALSYGIPVIASDLPGIKAIDGTGKLIRIMERFDPMDMANNLANEAMHPRKTETFLMEARTRMDEFSPERVSDKVMQVYEQLY